MGSVIVVMIVGPFLASPAAATTILPGPETALQAILDSHVGGGLAPNVQTAQISDDTYWHANGNSFSAHLVVELAGYAPNNSFGIYQRGNPAITQQLFGGADSAGANATVSIPAGWTDFGFYLQNTVDNFIWYSDPSLNAGGGLDHLVVVSGAPGLSLDGQPFGTKDYIFAWEDLNLGDQDYNDMVLTVRGIQPVPEAAGTAALLGLAFCGLHTLRRRLLRA